ncbi:MAG: SWIM zinc finger family protein [Anaerolineaceae bacterium]|nr:SWIM zinc finger family protein [Anaerolineaceae bacterium]
MKEILLTEEDIQLLSTEKSFDRGEDLYLSSAISDTFRKKNTIFGKCEGSGGKPYDLEVNFDGIEMDAFCTCPYDWGGLCKHLVAFLLTFVNEEELFTESVDIPTLLEPLDRENLIVLISKLVKEKPDLQNWMQKHIKGKFKD